MKKQIKQRIAALEAEGQQLAQEGNQAQQRIGEIHAELIGINAALAELRALDAPTPKA